MVRYATWRWVFYIMFPMCGLGTAMFTWMVISQPARRPTTTDFSRVNWFAEILFLISSASLLVAISRGGTQEAWRSIRTMAPLSIGAVGMLFSGIWKEGLFDWFHERSRSCRISNFAAYLSSAIQGFLLYGVVGSRCPTILLSLTFTPAILYTTILVQSPWRQSNTSCC